MHGIAASKTHWQRAVAGSSWLLDRLAALPVSLTCRELNEKMTHASDAHKMPLCHSGLQDSREHVANAAAKDVTAGACCFELQLLDEL